MGKLMDRDNGYSAVPCCRCLSIRARREWPPADKTYAVHATMTMVAPEVRLNSYESHRPERIKTAPSTQPSPIILFKE